MHQLEFVEVVDYGGTSGDDSITIPIALRVGVREFHFTASIDTGASYCLFRSELASVLGLRLEDGVPLRFRTANSTFDAYGHSVEIAAAGVVTSATVYFFADPSINKNVLGRSGWLDRVRLAIVHHDSRLYVSHYDQG